jgi:hypothetical protein
MYRWVLAAALLINSGCVTTGDRFSINQLVKTDIDLVADSYRSETTKLMNELLIKLYRRNPRELKKGRSTLALRKRQFSQSDFSEFSNTYINGSRGIAAIRASLSIEYSGDRVFTLMLGLSDMLNEAYGGKDEFYIFDELDQQKLYHSARNIEVLAWLLGSAKNKDGDALLLSNHASSDVANLSFERLLGKLIGHQDMMAIIVSGKTQRAINLVARGFVSVTFIPL